MSTLSFTYLLVLFAGCTASKQEFTVGEPATVISHERMKKAGIQGIDAGIYGIADKEDSQCKWFFTNRFKFVHTIGPPSSPFDNVVVNGGDIEGLPEPYTDTRLGFSSDHRWGNASWIANVYQNPENGHILGFVHLEYHPEKRGGVYFRFGLAISKDGGKSFKWCGYILEPDLTYETWFNQWHSKNPKGHHVFANMGLANYVIKDGYFFLYYADTRESRDTFSNGVAVARARVADVLSAAENRRTTPWNKYFNGAWDESGMGGKFTPLNIEPLGFLHGDAAYNSYLKRFVMVTRTGKVRPKGGPGKQSAIVISFSGDGINWSNWQTIHEDNRLHDYPSIISMGNDNEIVGKTFWVYYKYFFDSVLPHIDWPANRWDRIRVTVE